MESAKPFSIVCPCFPFCSCKTQKVAKSNVDSNQMWNVDLRWICPNSFCLSMLDLGRDVLVTGKQVVEIKHTLKEPRSLADPVRTTGHTRELHLRDICWSQANGEFRNISLCICVSVIFLKTQHLLEFDSFPAGQIELRIFFITFSEGLFILPST